MGGYFFSSVFGSSSAFSPLKTPNVHFFFERFYKFGGKDTRKSKFWDMTQLAEKKLFGLSQGSISPKDQTFLVPPIGSCPNIWIFCSVRLPSLSGVIQKILLKSENLIRDPPPSLGSKNPTVQFFFLEILNFFSDLIFKNFEKKLHHVVP